MIKSLAESMLVMRAETPVSTRVLLSEHNGPDRTGSCYFSSDWQQIRRTRTMCACTLLGSARQAWNRSVSVVGQALKRSPLKEQQPVKFHFTPLKESLQAERSWFGFSF